MVGTGVGVGVGGSVGVGVGVAVGEGVPAMWIGGLAHAAIATTVNVNQTVATTRARRRRMLKRQCDMWDPVDSCEEA
jgi:hypothetical protein